MHPGIISHSFLKSSHQQEMLLISYSTTSHNLSAGPPLPFFTPLHLPVSIHKAVVPPSTSSRLLRHFRCHVHMALPSLSTSKYVPVLQSPTPTPFSITIYKRYNHEPHIARLYFQGIDDFLCYRTPRKGVNSMKDGLFPESDPDSKRG